MKKLSLLSAISVIILSMTLTGCEVSGNGDLDGFWYMTRLDSIATGQSCDMRPARLSWSVQAKIIQFFDHEKNDLKRIPMARFEHDGNTLTISEAFIYNRMDGDEPLTADSLYLVRPYGVNSLPDTYHVEKLTSSRLQISDDVVRLYFEKY
ncbi:MAG: lipocalin-like domain-containing protein [Bacteroidales bacterium]|nr:lipocalin-like domain-containing protein [Candidatus Liminaster caballi]